MDKRQKVVLFITAGILILMLLVPPFSTYYKGNKIKDFGYHFIVDTPDPRATINMPKLLIQYIFVITIGGILYIAFKKKGE